MTVIDLDKGGRIPQTHRTYLGPTKGWVYTDEPTDIEWVTTAGGQVINSGFKGVLIIPEWLIINSWLLMSDIQGSIVFDVWKISLATFLAGTPPTVADSITGTDIPTLTNQYAAQGFALTGWTTEIKQNDVLGFNVISCVGISRITLSLLCIREIGQFSGVGVS